VTPADRQPRARILPDHTFTDPLTARISRFIREIGLPLEAAEIRGDTFLSGIEIQDGVLLVDETKLSHPRDLLLEAARLATAAPEGRGGSRDEVGDEMTAIAWSWAALVHFELEPEVVFHPEGHKDGSESIIENFSNGRFFRVPMLQWLGMAAEGERARELGVAPYPHMIRWLRDP
jgi:hypothetical protein